MCTEDGRDEIDDQPYYDDFGIYPFINSIYFSGNMTRERRMKREMEFFLSGLKDITEATMLDSHDTVTRENYPQLTHIVPQASTVYRVVSHGWRTLLLCVLFG